MVKAIKKFWKAQDTLERKMFWSILVVVTIVASFSAIFKLFLAIDSKFPLENYQNMVDRNNSDRNIYEKKFKIDMKKDASFGRRLFCMEKRPPNGSR